MWLFLIISTIWSLCSQEVFAADLYETMRDDAKKLKAPAIAAGPSFNRISILKLEDPNLGFDGDWLRSTSAETKKDLLSLMTQLADPQLVSIIMNGAPYLDDSEDEAQSESEIESYGLLSVLSTSVSSKVFPAARSHLKHAMLLPLFQAATWQEMRNERAIESSDPSSTDEYLAGRPITEFCIADAGLHLPTSAQMQFSIFDIGIAEASVSSMDLALLNLIEEPDAFRLATNIDDFDTNLESDYAPWQTVLSDWQQELKRKKRKLTEINTWWKKENTESNAKLNKFTAGLNELTKRWSSQCTKNGGRWVEGPLIRSAPSEWIAAECQSNRYGPLYRISINNSSAENATHLTFSLRQGALTALIQLHATSVDEPITFQIVGADERRLSSLLIFDNAGRMRARLGTLKFGNHVAWSPQGKVIWTGHQGPRGNWTEDVTWDEAGLPRAGFQFDNAGAITRLTEWYSDGLPASVTSFAADHREGLQQWWHQNGKLAGDSMWSYGKRFGTSHLKFEDGITGFDASYIDDQLDGYLTWRDDRNHQIMKANFNRGLVEGQLIISSDPDSELVRAKFDHGMAEGDVIIGQLKKRPTTVLPFKSGVLDGISTFYAIDQSVRMQVPFRSGKIHGDIKTFYKGGTRASTCKFDTSHLLSWQSWPPKSGTDFVRVEGSVIDPSTSRMTQTIVDDARKISARCDGRDDVWTSCSFTIQEKEKGKDKTKELKILDADLVKATQAIRVEGRPYNMAKCGGTTQMWDLRSWIESSSLSINVGLIPAPGCRDRTSVQCAVTITNKVQVKNCALVENDSEDEEDHHDHD